MELIATIPALLRQHAATYGSETILRKKDRGIWNVVDWTTLEQQVRDVGQGLRAAGLQAGESVVILSDTRPEIVIADLAILGSGAISVAIHTDEDATRVKDILRETNAAFAFVEGEEQLDKLLGVRADCPALRQIIVIDMKGLRDFRDPGCSGLDNLISGGASRTDWRDICDAVTPDQTAVILMPRVGPGKPVTHSEIIHMVDQTGQTLGFRAGDERLAVLPMQDPAERVHGLYLALKYRIISNYLENPETATENLREVKPTVLGANVEAWERLHARITGLARAATSVQKSLYLWAIGAAGRAGPLAVLARMAVLPAIRAELGFTRLRVAFVGDGAVSDEIARWAKALGVTVHTINPPR